MTEEETKEPAAETATAAAAETATATATETATATDTATATAAATEPAPAAAPEPAPPPTPSDLDEDEEPVWAALLSYETYEQVARKVLRAGTEVAREGYQRHDAAVVAIALALIIVGGFAHRFMLDPPMEDFDSHGLHFRRTAHWLAPDPVPDAPPRLIPGAGPPPRSTDDLPYHVMFTSVVDADARLEVLIDHAPTWSNRLTALEIERRNRYGELYSSDGGHTRSIAGRDWLRTSFHYVYAPSKGDQPRVGTAIEYATVDKTQLYVVTFHGNPSELDYLEDRIAPTLRVASKSGEPLVTQNRIAVGSPPTPVHDETASTVMIVIADMVDGRLRAVGGGSGAVVSTDGSIITNFHVIADRKKHDKLHDLFVIARSVGGAASPELICAGRPRAAKFDATADIALVKCEMDLDGRPWNAADGVWSPITAAPRKDVGLGERVWVLGYPDKGGGGVELSEGIVTGRETNYVKTDAFVGNGDSGGPVVDDSGAIIGIATAYRYTNEGGTQNIQQQGLVRPWTVLVKPLTWAKSGWQPRLDDNSFDVEPNGVEVAPEGVLIETHVAELGNDRPVPGAMLFVLKQGIRSGDVDLNRLDDQAIAWARANADGDIILKQPVPKPGTYTVVVMADGYDPLVGDGALQLTADTKDSYDPWGVVKIRSFQ